MSLSVVRIQEPAPLARPLYTERFDAVRHRGLRQALEALRPGLLVCHPDTFDVRYANEAARSILSLGNASVPTGLPELLTLTRQEEYVSAERRHVACYRAEIADSRYDVRALPVYTTSGQVEAVLVMIRSYDDISWSLYEMLDRLPVAIAALSGDGEDITYINRTALREIYALRAQNRARRVSPRKADPLLDESLTGWLKQSPVSGEGRAEVFVGRNKVDMHFAKLGATSGRQLIYWDPRGHGPSRH